MAVPSLDEARRSFSPARFLKAGTSDDLSGRYFYILICAVHLLAAVVLFTGNIARSE